jgi:hypothetical protein
MKTYPRYIGLMPGILVRIDSAEEEERLRRSERRALVWGPVVGMAIVLAIVGAVLACI